MLVLPGLQEIPLSLNEILAGPCIDAKEDYRAPNPKAAGEFSLFSSLRHKETWAGKRCGHTMNL